MSGPLEPGIAPYTINDSTKTAFAEAFGIKIPSPFGAAEAVSHAHRHLEAMCGAAAMLGMGYAWSANHPDAKTHEIQYMLDKLLEWNEETSYTFPTSGQAAYVLFCKVFTEAVAKHWLKSEEAFVISAGTLLSDLVFNNIRNDPSVQTQGLMNDNERLRFACHILGRACG